MTSKRGFTLIELIVVVVIVGVLAGMAAAKYLESIEKTRGAEAKEILLKAYAGYHRLLLYEESVSPYTWESLGMPELSTLPGRFFNYAFWPNTNSPTKITATRIGDSSKQINISLADGTITKSSPY